MRQRRGGERILGINRRYLVKAFNGQEKCSGKYEEGLYGIMDVFEELADMFDVSYRQRLQIISILLKCNALIIFMREAKDCKTFEEEANILKDGTIESKSRVDS